MTPINHQQHYAQSQEGLKLFYRDYAGPADRTPVICLHGLTRNSRDFEDLAPHIAQTRRVLSLDFRGRGYSDHDPEFGHYQPPIYAADTLAVMDAAGIARAIIIGTSLGGMVAMIVAQQFPQRLAATVLNDIGPELAPEGLERIKTYTGKLAPVKNWDDAVSQTKQTYAAAWPGLDNAAWRKLAQRSYRENAQGIPTLDMDPNIGRAIRQAPIDLGDPWELFSALTPMPLLLLRGALSDLLAVSTVEKMRKAHPHLSVTEVPNRGHVPLLDEPLSLKSLDQFLADIP